MDQGEDPRDLELKIEQAARIASGVNDPTTVERLRAWIEDLKQRLRHRREAKRIKQETTVRATNSGKRMDDLQAATWSLVSSRV